MKIKATVPDAPAVTHVAHGEDDPPAFLMRVVLLLVERREIAPYHHLDEALGREILALEGTDITAVTQHSDAIRKLIDLAHAVTNVDDGQSLCAQAADQIEKLVRLAGRKRGCRLVHDED